MSSISDNNIQDEQHNINDDKRNSLEIYQPPYDTNKNEQSYFIQINKFTQEKYEYNFTLNYSSQHEIFELPTQALLIIDKNSDTNDTTISLLLKINSSHLTHVVFTDVYISYFSWTKSYFISKIKSKEKIKPNQGNNSESNKHDSINEFHFSNFHTFNAENPLPSKNEPFIIMIKVSLSDKPNIFLPSKQYIGIANEGFTCYMNTIVQTIYHLPFLRNEILSKDNKSSINDINQLVLFTLKKIIYLLHNSINSYIPIKELFHALGWERSFWNSPQDVQEIYSYLYEIFSSRNPIIKDNCEGELTTVIEVPCKDYISRKKEKFLFLQLDIPKTDSTLDAILKCFFAKEFLTGDNRYLYISNDNLHSYQDAQKHFEFTKLPNILFIQLKRFYCDIQNNTNQKLFHRVEYQQTLNVKEFINKESISDIDETVYKLYAVIVHSGMCNSGHYFTYIYDFKQTWHCMNDKNVETAGMSEVFEQNFGGKHIEVNVDDNTRNLNVIEIDNQRTAYILIYIKESQIEYLMKKVQINSKIGDGIQAQINIIKDDIEMQQIKQKEMKDDIGDQADLLMNEIIKVSKDKKQFQEQSSFHSANSLNNNNNINPRQQQVKYIYQPIMRREEKPLSKKNIIYPSKLTQQQLKFSSIPQKDIFTSKFILTFDFIDNKTNKTIFSLKYTFNKDTQSSPFIVPTLLFELKQNNKESFNLNLSSIKLICLNSLGFFQEILNETIDISSYLEKFYKKEIHLVFYIFEIDETMKFDEKLTSINVFDINFYHILQNDADKNKVSQMNIMKYPILFIGNDLYKERNKKKFVKAIENTVKLIYEEFFDRGEFALVQKSSVPLFIIESSSNFESINKFSSLKVNQISLNDELSWIKINKSNKTNRFIYGIERTTNEK